MTNSQSSLRVHLLYSYSHKDSQHRAAMETTLASLKRSALLEDWSDAEIIPGQSISAALQAKLPESDIVVFLLSPDFLDSDECLKEWRRAAELESSGRLVFRVPIIVRDCAWQDFLGEDDVKALPLDGKAITTYSNPDTAWKEVYEGVKSVIDSLRTTFTPKPAFLSDMKNADLPSTNPLSLDDIFVFPRLVTHDYTATNDILRESPVTSLEDLLDQGHSVIHGEDKSGKTALAKHIFLSLVDREKPVLFADFSTISGRPREDFLRTLYHTEFNGDYYLWERKSGKTLIIDNMTEAPSLLDYVADCSELFSRIYIFVSSDVYHSFLTDDLRLTDFAEVRLDPLTLTQQEQLIRKRLTKLEKSDLTDGFVDQAEDRVNSIIISHKIVPRYPFFVLSILQTYDAFTPRPLSITSYGHCYYVFIIASLRRAGISEADDAVNSSFNFAEQLALATFVSRREPSPEPLDFDAFRKSYRSSYFIRSSLLNRLTHKDYGIITERGEFKTKYMYYFFLGKVLATNSELAKEYLPELCEHSYDEGNYLTLLFAIHHATDDAIIEDILLRTMVELDDVAVATLDETETSRFSSIVSELPESVLSDESVEEERAKERQQNDDREAEAESKGDGPQGRKAGQVRASMLRILKNNKILGQVLRNQYGKLQKSQIEEIVETVADSSFRLVNLVLKDEEEIRKLALSIKAKKPEADLAQVQQILRYMSFIWTMMNVEQAVHAVNVPTIREAVDTVVAKNRTPAYDIFGYFNEIDSAEELTTDERDKLAALYKDHRDQFVKRVLSIRTQAYMNTHRSRTSVEQSICSVLGIKYMPRPISGGGNVG